MNWVWWHDWCLLNEIATRNPISQSPAGDLSKSINLKRKLFSVINVIMLCAHKPVATKGEDVSKIAFCVIKDGQIHTFCYIEFKNKGQAMKASCTMLHESRKLWLFSRIKVKSLCLLSFSNQWKEILHSAKPFTFCLSHLHRADIKVISNYLLANTLRLWLARNLEKKWEKIYMIS